MFNLTSLPSCNFAILSSRWQLGEVDSTEGAGLDLDPETQGMRVTKAWWMFASASCSNSLRCPGFFRETTCEVYDKPGQPGLYERDLITKIDEAPLRGETKDQAEQSVSSEFFDANLERTCFHDFSWCSGLVATPCCVQVETIFGKNFRDGVLLTIKRESWSIQKWTASWTNTCTR